MEKKETQKDVNIMKRGRNRDLRVVRNCLMEVGSEITWDHGGVVAWVAPKGCVLVLDLKAEGVCCH